MFKHRSTYLDAGVLKYPYGQTFDYELGRDLDKKIRMRKKFYDKLPGQLGEVSQPRKAMTWEEYERTNVKRREFRR